MKETKRMVLAGLLAALPAMLWGAAAEPRESCRECHKDEKFRVQNKKIYDYYQEWKGSPHDLAGLSCTACHNGDPTKASKEEAHKGILPQSDPASPFHYKNIPKTCGGCHASILERFVKSRHYEQLTASGRGPSCITCHGSLDSRAYPMTIVDRACSVCHNKESGNHPDVPEHAREILARLNYANGYRKGLQFYYKSVKKPQAVVKLDQAYDDTILLWHEFNFQKLGPRSEELLARLKALYVEAHEKDAPEK